MRCRVWVLCAVLAVAAMAEAQTPENNQTVVTLDQGQAYEATSQDGRWVARIFVTPAPALDSKSIVVEIKGVSSGARSDPALAALFEAPSSWMVGNGLQAFDLSTKKGVDIPHGTYNVLLTFSIAQTRQLSTVQLTIPAAVLAPAHLLITRVLPFLGVGGGGEAPSLILRETGGRSPVKVQFAEDRFSDANGEYGGQLVLEDVTVAEGKQKPVKYSVEGDFPLGTAKSNLTLLSHQLDSPATVPVEVRTRRTRILLMFLVVWGLVLGFLMRTILKQQIQFGEARQKAIEELNKLRHEGDMASDDDYRSAIQQAITPLLVQIEQARASRVSDLAGAVTTAEAAWKAAGDALKSRTDEAATTLKAIAEVVETRWNVSDPAASQLRVSQARLGAVRGALTRGNVAEATHGLNLVIESLRSTMEKTVRPYRAAYEGFIDDIAAVGSLLLPEAQDDFQTATKQLQDLAKAMPDVAPGDDIAKLKSLLAAMSQARSAAESTLANLGVKVVQTFSAMNEELSPVSLPESSQWNAASLATRRFGGFLSDVAADLAKNSPDMRRRATDLKRQWWKALSAQAGARPAPAGMPDLSAAFDLFQQGKYKDAVVAVANIVRGGPKKKLMGIMPGLALIDENETEEATVPLRVAPAVDTPDVPWETPYQPRRASETIQTLETRTFRELIGAKFAQWVISAAGLAFVGYLLFADKFVGTAPELLTAFFWGFTTDVGLDALISAGKSK